MNDYNFDTFITKVNHQLASRNFGQNQVFAIRELLRQALTQKHFELACIERVMSTMKETLAGWQNPPIYTNQEFGYSMRLIYWPPQYKNNPHEHNSWTITGVFYNQLKVATYRWEKEGQNQRLVVENSFDCKRGEVGNIIPPCIHNVWNPSTSVSISLHIFGGVMANTSHESDGEDFGYNQTVWYPSPRKGEIAKGVANRVLMSHTEILKQIPEKRSLKLLDRIFELGDMNVKLASVKAMTGIDAQHAANRLGKLSKMCPEPTRSKLQQLSAKLKQTVDKN